LASTKSIYISDAAEAVIGTIRDDGTLSGRINSIIVRYGAITEKECPELTVNEWLLLCDILNSTWRECENPRFDVAPRLWVEVLESEPDGMAEKWSVDLENLAQRLRSTSYAGQCAVIEIVNRWWSHGNRAIDDTTQALKDCGARIKQ